MRMKLVLVGLAAVVLAGCSVTPSDITDMSQALRNYREGSDGAARATVERLVAQRRTDPARAALVLQSVCFQAGRADDAARYATRALSVADKGNAAGMAQLYTVLGMAKHEMGRTDEAIEAYRNALRYRGDDHTAMNNLGYVYAEAPPSDRRLAEALTLTTRAVKLARERGVPDAQVGVFVDSVGWVQFRMGRNREAIVTLTEALELAPDEPDVAYHLARAYLAAERRPEAVTMLRRAVAMKPTLDVASRLLDSLLADSGGDSETREAPRP